MAYFTMPQRRRCFTATIVDSGERREFESGAVRDVAEGKGRCDLLPIDIVAELLNFYCTNYEEIKRVGDPLISIYAFMMLPSQNDLFYAICNFCVRNSWDIPQMVLEVSKHFEDGAKKYGERNWEKGIPAHCYVDSAIRHYLKWYWDLIDERHDRAFCWNLLCLAWTLKHRPECNDLWGDDNRTG